VVHFVADMIFAVPLLLVPGPFLGALGWTCVDPISARLVGAALVGIGVESLLGRNAELDSFQTMLRLKVLWSSTATLGIVASMLQGAPTMGWAFAATFGGFCCVWSYWLSRVRRLGALSSQKGS